MSGCVLTVSLLSKEALVVLAEILGARSRDIYFKQVADGALFEEQFICGPQDMQESVEVFCDKHLAPVLKRLAAKLPAETPSFAPVLVGGDHLSAAVNKYRGISLALTQDIDRSTYNYVFTLAVKAA